MEKLSIMRASLYDPKMLDQGFMDNLKNLYRDKKIIICVPDLDFQNVQPDVEMFIQNSVSLDQTLTDNKDNRYYVTSSKNYNAGDTDLKGHGGSGNNTGQGDGKGHGGSGNPTGQGDKGHGGSGNGTGQGNITINISRDY
jgi:hypothetical protein